MSKTQRSQPGLQFPDAPKDATAIVRAFDAAPTVEVVFRSAVGACIPFTVLPAHYVGKKVRIVIADGADD